MLGNRYFLTGKFNEAIPHLEKTLSTHPDEVATLKKLMICYVASENIERALTKLDVLLTHVPEQLFTGKPGNNDCPCPELLEQWTATPPGTLTSLDYLLGMGLLALFCDVGLASRSFTEAKKLAPDMEILDKVLKLCAAQLENK
ncbi:tetratricopeptide repeat protein [candidate division KSB1 bacterium]|nr:tetratricopeptide repeat protein [candidate division KSB1 bacterium]NIT70894.1 tetratricopeptide repeat protein [candidate division KSB1 bacterium]NIU26381.1 tetratricopeptide repeat protein [candidate division KSB1 bacterium]NIU90197.1 tetratricopeptide repeat protein [candidate division KSB1 bacterium]NIV93750.1 tetratricopeptide repeat protein [candidate division KSB1 bacterium]